ncbi:hypothetical protein CAL14_08430 [Bordetella genomosp. 9]|uniref:GrlR family regulatory protein n=1 Tax=Bordetella genomosp. 9 TaxID=1416803 RepID=UPI000A28DD55|nr:GrlR family regulatory protein [Bordetella genomosp. 9]ARP90308.1 hypothetical protein CAL14_08430 [Bordetella genomosp. 9]
MIRNGFYKVKFSAQIRDARGLVVLENGTIKGGDDEMVYVGEYGEQSANPSGPSQMTATISVRAYVPGANSVFNSGDRPYKLSLSGKASGDSFTLEGPSPFGGPGITIQGSFVAPLEF